MTVCTVVLAVVYIVLSTRVNGREMFESRLRSSSFFYNNDERVELDPCTLQAGLEVGASGENGGEKWIGTHSLLQPSEAVCRLRKMSTVYIRVL